jgi:two-component system CheB/CheR fusion protein
MADVSNVFGTDLLERMATEVVETGEAQGTELHETSRDRAWRVDVKPYRGPDGFLEGAMLVFEDVTALRDLRHAVERQDERLRSVRKLARIAVWQYEASAGMLTIDDSSNLLGIGETARLPVNAFAALIAPQDRQAIIDGLADCARGNSMRRIVSPSADGMSEVRLEAAGDCFGSGANAQVLGVLLDVTAVESAARLREAVIHEMDHRVKNLFTQISAMLRMAARHADSPAQLAEEVSGRINALAQSHSLTTRRSAASEIGLDPLIRTTLAPYARGDAEPVRPRGGRARHQGAAPVADLPRASHERLQIRRARRAARPASGRVDADRRACRADLDRGL